MKGSIAAAMCVVASLVGMGAARAQNARTVDVSVTIRADRPGPTINRNLYGHFAEHLGAGIYEGIWVGENSPIPNTRGYRNDVIAALKKLQVPVVRWPGGCFADEYHWREGIGPREQRPVKVNTHWGYVEEPNAFGTHEFLDFAELIGAEAYVAGNVGSGTPREMAEWVEYITSDTGSSLAQLRKANGRDRPWRLPYFGVGNETWGCGGNMRPEFFADIYRRFQTFIKTPADNRTVRVASGANADDYRWTDVMLSGAARHMDAYSLHYYTFPGRWEDKRASTGFPEEEWASTLKHALRMDELVGKHSAAMDRHDPNKRIGLYVDEWGTWYSPEPGRNPGFLWQHNTLRDAVVAALTFDIFHKHADRVRMANIAQMVNVLQAVILTEKERMILTPTYHVFEMYLPFQDATYLPAEFAAPEYRLGEWSLPAVDVSAARSKDGKLHASFVNLDPNRAATITTTVQGAAARNVTGRLLTAEKMDARNTVDKPNAVQPVPFKVQHQGGKLVLELPAKSIVVLAME